MVLVLLGTLNHSFVRLIVKIEELKNKGVIQDDVIVQAGETKYVSQGIKIVDYLTSEDFDNYIKNASLIISHGGLGSIVTSMRFQKKVIVIPRSSKYKEHVDNHQIEIVELFNEKGYILMSDVENLEEAFLRSKDFLPVPYPFESALEEFIFNLEKEIALLT